MSPSPTTGRRRQVPFSVYLVLALACLAGLWGVAAPKSHADVGNSEAVAKGYDLFKQGCSSCHGLNAQGGNQAPGLIGVGAAAVDFQVSSGRMPLAAPGAEAARSKARYSQPEIDQLAAYVASLAPGPAEPNVNVAEGNLQQGGELFRLNCAQCHNFAGAGGALTHGKYAPNLYPASAKQIVEAIRTGPESMPVFGPDQLNEQQATSIATYVRAITRSQDPGGHAIGRLGPIPEGLVIWTVGIGALVAAAFWIGARQ